MNISFFQSSLWQSSPHNESRCWEKVKGPSSYCRAPHWLLWIIFWVSAGVMDLGANEEVCRRHDVGMGGITSSYSVSFAFLGSSSQHCLTSHLSHHQEHGACPRRALLLKERASWAACQPLQATYSMSLLEGLFVPSYSALNVLQCW